jgi:uncharacterized protein YdaU (DUF1376 family)
MARKSKFDIWMPVFIGDYLAETMHLTAAQHGSYLLLLMAAWRRDGTLPDDDARFTLPARMSAAEWAENRAILAEFFTIADGMWRHERLTEEYQRAREN